MDIQDRIDAVIRQVGESFASERAAYNRLNRILAKFPDTTLQETWDALPMLFFRGIFNESVLRVLPYDEFLQTSYWLAVSNHVREKYPWCVLCVEPLTRPLEVHHRTYAHKGSEWLHLDDLSVLCHECHDWISKKPSRWKLLLRKG
jgi:hypothetical protein